MATVLVLEDDPANMQIISALLWSAGFRVLEANSGHEAIENGKHHPDGIDLLISDISLPDRSGTEVALELTKSHPVIATLFISGTPMDGWARRDLDNVRRLDRVDFLEKPFRPITLIETSQKLLGIPASPMVRALHGRA